MPFLTGKLIDRRTYARQHLVLQSVFLINFVLEYIQVIGGSYSNNALRGVPGLGRIFLLKAKLSTLISSFFLLTPVHTFRGFSLAQGSLFSLSSVTSL